VEEGSVAEAEIERAIVAHLVRPGVTTRNQASPSGWTSSIVRGGPGADPATIRMQRTRAFPACQMHQVGFTNHKGAKMEGVIRTWREDDGTWAVGPVGGGSADGHPRRSHPWVNFAAGYGATGLAAGGRVIGEGAAQARSVRLTFANGITSEDIVESGIVLFFEDRELTFPAQVSIVGKDGELLAGHEAFELFASR
jgi:hypothetical protein